MSLMNLILIIIINLLFLIIILTIIDKGVEAEVEVEVTVKLIIKGTGIEEIVEVKAEVVAVLNSKEKIENILIILVIIN
jgi:hypothetical protein